MCVSVCREGVREPAIVRQGTKYAHAVFISGALGNEGLKNALEGYYFKNQEKDKLKFKEN